jgi:hypothetical protein
MGAMLQSLNEALASPAIAHRPAVDDQGNVWENTTLEMFLEAMSAWMTDTGWTAHDRRAAQVWTALSAHGGENAEDQDDLRRYLADLVDWASDPGLPEDQHWAPAALALRAGRGTRKDGLTFSEVNQRSQL